MSGFPHAASFASTPPCGMLAGMLLKPKGRPRSRIEPWTEADEDRYQAALNEAKKRRPSNYQRPVRPPRYDDD